MSQHQLHHLSALTLRVLTVLVAGLGLGCASTGAPVSGTLSGARSIETGERVGARMGSLPEFKSAQRSTVRLPIAAAWTSLTRAYETLGIPLTMMTPTTNSLGNEGMRRTHNLAGTPLSTFLDCGSGTGGGPNADMYAVTMSVVSQLQVVSDTSTEVATMVQATAAPLSFGSPEVTCSTTGSLEQRIVALIRGQTK